MFFSNLYSFIDNLNFFANKDNLINEKNYKGNFSFLLSLNFSHSYFHYFIKIFILLFILFIHSSGCLSAYSVPIKIFLLMIF